MSHRPVPDSEVGRHLKLYVESKQAKGLTFAQEARGLRRLQRHPHSRGIHRLAQLTPQAIRRFAQLSSHRSNDSYNALVNTLERAFNWLVVQGHLPKSPVALKHRTPQEQKEPYIFSDEESRELLRLAGAPQVEGSSTIRGPIFETIFALMRGLGLRISEAAKPRIEHVDLSRGVLKVRNTKFGKERDLPFGPAMRKRLKAFLELRTTFMTKPSDYLFTFDGVRRISDTTIRRRFMEIMSELGLPTRRPCPHPHDLRHTFAVASIIKWHQEGADVAEMLEWLSTYLGHTSVTSTAVYMTITAEVRRLAGGRFERAGSRLLPRVRK